MVYTYIYHKNQLNVGRYAIHGSSGYYKEEWFMNQHKETWWLDFQGICIFWLVISNMFYNFYPDPWGNDLI